jgi:hypothetical protein
VSYDFGMGSLALSFASAEGEDNAASRLLLR